MADNECRWNGDGCLWCGEWVGPPDPETGYRETYCSRECRDKDERDCYADHLRDETKDQEWQ